MRNRRRATSADVAREAGVSRATVSYVLNDTPNQKIPEQTREKVLEAARKLAYSPSTAARALRRPQPTALRPSAATRSSSAGADSFTA